MKRSVPEALRKVAVPISRFRQQVIFRPQVDDCVVGRIEPRDLRQVGPHDLFARHLAAADRCSQCRRIHRHDLGHRASLGAVSEGLYLA